MFGVFGQVFVFWVFGFLGGNVGGNGFFSAVFSINISVAKVTFLDSFCADCWWSTHG